MFKTNVLLTYWIVIGLEVQTMAMICCNKNKYRFKGTSFENHRVKVLNNLANIYSIVNYFELLLQFLF